MTARRYLAAYLGAGVVFAGLDAVWLTATNAALYRLALGRILTPGFRPAPAIAFYLIYLAGVVVFAIAPAIRANAGWRGAATRGGLLGFFCYATYDLTNQATLIVWATRVTVLDLAWGILLTATGATAGYLASKLVGPT